MADPLAGLFDGPSIPSVLRQRPTAGRSSIFWTPPGAPIEPAPEPESYIGRASRYLQNAQDFIGGPKQALDLGIGLGADYLKSRGLDLGIDTGGVRGNEAGQLLRRIPNVLSAGEAVGNAVFDRLPQGIADVGRGAQEGLLEKGSALVTDPTLALLPEHRLVGAAFLPSIVRGAGEELGQAGAELGAGNYREAARHAAGGLVDTGFGILAGAHALRGAPVETAPAERPNLQRPAFLDEVDRSAPAIPPGPELGYGRGGVPVNGGAKGVDLTADEAARIQQTVLAAQQAPPPAPPPSAAPVQPEPASTPVGQPAGMDLRFAPQESPVSARDTAEVGRLARMLPELKEPDLAKRLAFYESRGLPQSAEAVRGEIQRRQAPAPQPVVEQPETPTLAQDASAAVPATPEPQAAPEIAPQANLEPTVATTRGEAGANAPRRLTHAESVAAEVGRPVDDPLVQRIVTAETDHITGLPLRSVYERDLSSHQGAVASMDLAGLKWVNDNLGHPAGDAVLRAAGEAIRGEDGVRAYRTGGDEFVVLADTPEQATEAAARIQERLRGGTFSYRQPNGEVVTYTGGRLDYGVGQGPTGPEGFAAADQALYESRAAAEARGERAARGTRPPSLAEVPAEGRGADGDVAPESGLAPPAVPETAPVPRPAEQPPSPEQPIAPEPVPAERVDSLRAKATEFATASDDAPIDGVKWAREHGLQAERINNSPLIRMIDGDEAVLVPEMRRPMAQAPLEREGYDLRGQYNGVDPLKPKDFNRFPIQRRGADGEWATIERGQIRNGAPPEGLEPRFASAAPYTGSPVTLDHVSAAFPAGKVSEREGGYSVSLPGNRTIRIDRRGEIAYQPEAFEKGYGRKLKEGEEQIVGSFNRVGRDAIIQLAKGADAGTLSHESFHAAMDLALSRQEREAVLRHYKNEEAAADAYAKWKPAEKANTLFGKIREFFHGIYRAFRPSWESAFEAARSGEAYERSGKGAVPRVAEQAYAVAAKAVGDRVENFKAWFGASKVVNEKGEPVKVFHGTQRPDRLGTKFRKDRATSGPMPFFTEDPAIASKYAEGKQDTSIETPSDYSEWFKVKPAGARSTVDLDRAWWHLSSEERQRISDNLPHVRYADEENYSKGFALGGKDEYGLSGGDHWHYEIKQARGNVLKAAKEIWLAGGNLVGDEQQFMDVLRLGGMDMKKVTFDDPNAVNSGVLATYLSIKNPLEAEKITPQEVEQLQRAANRSRGNPQQYGADAWDKRTRDPQHWMEMLRENPETAWTSIPDWVTRELRRMGYDGIKDTGGKMGGDKHTVWVPFEPTQIKSAIGNRGTFDPTNPDIRYSTSRDEALLGRKVVRGEAQARGYDTERYGHSQPVRVTFPDGSVTYDEIKGLNKGHALARAEANWSGAKIEPMTAGEFEYARRVEDAVSDAQRSTIPKYATAPKPPPDETVIARLRKAIEEDRGTSALGGALSGTPTIRKAMADILPGKSFDTTMLRLMDEGKIQMQAHPIPSQLTAEEKAAMPLRTPAEQDARLRSAGADEKTIAQFRKARGANDDYYMAIGLRPGEPKYATAPKTPPVIKPIPPKLKAVQPVPKEELGRPMRPEEAHRVDTKVDNLKAIEPNVKLSRDAPRTWGSLDTEIRKRMDAILEKPEKEAALYEKARSGKINDVEVQTLDALVAGKREAYDTIRERLLKAQEEGKDAGQDNTAYLKAAFDKAAADLAVAARSDVEAGTKLARALAARGRVMESIGEYEVGHATKRAKEMISTAVDHQWADVIRRMKEDGALKVECD